MRVKFFLLVCCFVLALLSSCHRIFFPRNFGKIEYLRNDGLELRDSFYVLPHSYVYNRYSNRFISEPKSVQRYKGVDTFGTLAPIHYWNDTVQKNERMRSFERRWDSSINFHLNRHFRNLSAAPLPRDTSYGEYRFQFRYRGGTHGIEWAMGDFLSIQLGRVAWLIKDGFVDSAVLSLPKIVSELSYKRPVLFISNYTSFDELELQVNYGTTSTGLRFSPISMIVIVKEGKIIYYRNSQDARGYKSDAYADKILSKVTEKLFDKLQ